MTKSLPDISQDQMPLTLCEVIENADRDAGLTEAIVADESRVTYANLQAKSLQVAAALTAAGLHKGDHIGICFGERARLDQIVL